MKRKLFSILTALALCLSMFPAAALAVEGGAQLTEGGTYYFDLSGAGIPGNKVNSSLPGGSLSWVPFTYVGEVNAYVLKESSANVEGAIAAAAAATDPAAQYGYTYSHSLFIADRYVKSGLKWSNTDLNPGSVIFGKTYASGGVSYTLRAPSTGMGTGSGACEPGNNEWDVILNQSEDYIKNWSEAGFWGQEVYKETGGIISVLGCHARGKNSIRGSSLMAIPNTTDAAGFRPVLELPAGLTAGDLSVVTVDLNGGSLDAKASVDLAVKSGSGFTAPGSTGVAAPEISGETMTFEGWTDGENTYQPGDAIPAGVTRLTAKWDVAPRCSIAADQTSLHFGSVYPDYSAADMRKTVTVTNTGNQPVTLELSTAQTFSVSELSKAELAPNETASFTVQPPAGLRAGSYSDTVTVKGASGDQRTNEVTITSSFTVQAYSSASALNTGGTYYFDLSGAGIPGSRNWVAFTYAGQISAYSGTNYSSYDHCLFIAENSVVNETWNNLDGKGLIYGKTYASGGVNYTLRAPSGGTGSAADGGGTPTNNEWDVIRGKNFIKNDSFRSLAQDRIKGADIEKMASVVRQGENFELVTPTYPFSFRPVLELPRDLSDSGLRSPALYLNGGSLDGREKADIVVKSGEAFPAPGAEGLTAPSGKELSGWRGSDGVTYNAGDSVPETVEYLVAQWRSVYYTVIVQAGENGSVSGGGSFEANTSVTVTAAPDEGCQFLHWEEDGKTVSTEESYTFRVTGNRTLTAVFEHVHEWGNWTPDGDGVHHSRVCNKDETHRETEVCTYGEYSYDGANHAQTCELCGYKKEEAHNIKCTAEASGTVIAVREACEICGYGKDLGTVKVAFENLVYGNPDAKVTFTNIPANCILMCQDFQHAGGMTEVSWTLAQLFSSTKVTAGGHKLKVSFLSDVRSNECELDFTIDPAPLTPSITGTAIKTFDGTKDCDGTGLSIALDGVVNGDTVAATASYAYDNANAGENKTITASGITLGGADAGNYELAHKSASISGTITKAYQAAPAAPTAADTNIKDTSITLDTIANAEYSKDGTTWQDSPMFTGLDPNTAYTFYARLKEDANHNASPASAGKSITTKKTMLDGAAVTVSGTYTYTGAAIVPEAGNVTVVLNGVTIDVGQYTISATNNINAGTATLTVTATETSDYSGSVSTTFTIAPATLTVDGPGTASGTYGSKLSELAVTGLTAKLGETEVHGTWKLTGDTIPNVDDTGTHEATFTPSTGANNYILPLTAPVTLSISKATALTPTPGTLEIQNKQTKTYSYDLTRLLPALSDGKTLGDVTYTLAEPVNLGSYYESGAKVENSTLTLPIQAVDTEALADIGTVTVTITSQNYADMTATITVKSVNKTAVDITGVTLTGRAYNGSPIAYQKTAAASVGGSPVSVKGFVYTWNTPDGIAPVNAGSYTLTVSVDPEDPTYTGSTTVPVTIEQAEITITAPSRTIYVGGTAPTFSASDCAVTGLVSGESLKTPPTVAYEETPDTSKTGSVTVKASGAAVPDGGNYKEQIVYVDGTLTVKEPSSSGGGGGGDTPVNVTGVSLDRNSLTLTIGESFSLTVTITPSNADNKSVTWASGNSDVASVNGGTVTATGVGTTTITVTTQSGGYTASCTVTVKAKAYTITYDANGGAGTMRTGSAADGEPFTLPGCTFTPPEGKVFDAWAIGSADGTQVKAGSSHTFTEDTNVYAVWKDAPLVTYAVTYNANGGTGTMTNGIAPDQEAFVLPECGFTAPEGKEFDCWAIGSATGPKVQPGGGYIFTANTTVYALWKDLPPVPYDITGIVWQNGEAVPGATVQLKRGADVVAAQTTGSDGSFTFSGVPAGVYNLVAIKDGITVTVMQEITSGSVNLTITLPNGKTNTVVEIKGQEGTPPVVVGEMEKLFTDDTVYTAEDKEIVATGGTVEFKMVVGKQDASSSAAIQIEASKPAGQTIGLFLDLSIIKTVTPKDGQAETTSVTQVGSLIETLIPLPDEMQGKASYTVYREHDGIVEALPNSGNGERYTVSSDKKSITIYARKYSTYAVAWSDNGGDTPVDPGKPSRPSGGSGSSVSTYAVTVSKTTYGKVVSSRTNASSGSTVTLTVTPDSGYTLDTLTVTDSRGNAVKLTDKGNGKYTFTMPSRAVTVTASFTPIVWNNPYADVAAGTWYYEAVRFVSENGLMGGYGKGLFGPNDSLSRAQLVQILYNHAGRPVIQNGSAFTDAAPGAWYADAVAWAAAEGIISGYGGGRFGPNDPITREQLAVILWRYAGFPVPPNLLLDFPDANTASGYALDALRWAVEQGIISGYSNGRLEPKTPATRGQVAQILRNFLQKQ